MKGSEIKIINWQYYNLMWLELSQKKKKTYGCATAHLPGLSATYWLTWVAITRPRKQNRYMCTTLSRGVGS